MIAQNLPVIVTDLRLISTIELLQHAMKESGPMIRDYTPNIEDRRDCCKTVARQLRDMAQHFEDAAARWPGLNEVKAERERLGGVK